MRIVENLCKINSEESIQYKYFYRLTRTKFKGLDAYGIEIERKDFRNGILINIERDSMDTIAYDENKVRKLLNLLYEHAVSPIHFIDVLGECIDKYVQDFEKCA